MLSSCRRVVVSSCLATALLVFCGCRSDSPRPQFISIATGGTGGVYYPYGGGLAKVLNDSLPNIRATAEVTAASVDNLKFIRDGKADVAFALADTVADAAAGRGAFEGRSVPVAALAVLYSNYTHVVTLQSSGITTIAGLRGRRVSTGSPGSGTEVIAFRVLRAAGLNPDADVTRQGLGASESADSLKDGKIDAFFWSGGLPTAAVQDLAHSQGITIGLIPTGDLVAALQREHGDLYFPLDDSRRRLSGRPVTCRGRWRRQRPCRERGDAGGSSPTTSPVCCSRNSRSWRKFIPRRAICLSRQRRRDHRLRSIAVRSATFASGSPTTSSALHTF